MNRGRRAALTCLTEGVQMSSGAGQLDSGPPRLFDNQLLSYKQAAQYLCISEVYLRKLKAHGRMPFVSIGVRGVRFRVSSLNQWIREREIR